MAYMPKDYKRDIVTVVVGKRKALVATKHKRRRAEVEDDETAQRFNSSERSHKHHWVRRRETNAYYEKLIRLLKNVVRKYYGQPIHVCYAHFSRVVEQIYKGERGGAAAKTGFWKKIVKDGESSNYWVDQYHFAAQIVEDENKNTFTIEPLV